MRHSIHAIAGTVMSREDLVRFTVLSGETFSVFGKDTEDALARFYARCLDEPCACGVESCDCVEHIEAQTLIIPT